MAFASVGTSLVFSMAAFAGTCIPKPVPVKIEKSNTSVTFEGDNYILDVVTYTADTPSFLARWVEKGDPAYELAITNKINNTTCKITNDEPFITFEDDVIYQAKNGKILIMMEGIASSYQSSFYDTATCKRIAHIDNVYPNNIYTKYFFGENSTMKLGGGLIYDLGNKCIPSLKSK